MKENIRIKCPICGTVLTVKNMLGIESKSIPCPICKTTSKFLDFKTPAAKPVLDNDSSKTEYEEAKTECKIEHRASDNCVIGGLKLLGSSFQYNLKIGRNIVGRKASSSSADIQIETNERTMSRSHSYIEVVKLNSGEYKHYLSNANNKNATFVNNEKVEAGDKLVLSGGEIIKMGNVVLNFVIADD